MALKGKVSSDMWLKMARNFDNVNKIVERDIQNPQWLSQNKCRSLKPMTILYIPVPFFRGT